LPKIDPAADTFEAKMTVLKELIEHHVEEEQDEIFPMAEKRLGASTSLEPSSRRARKHLRRRRSAPRSQQPVKGMAS
jgi:hemerythrin-like domain-containing protein